MAVATSHRHFGVTQVLAGAPMLVERYEPATGPGRALLLAAIDTQRLGLTPPLSGELLTAAARGYLAAAHPTDDWAPPALEDLSRRQGPGTAPPHPWSLTTTPPTTRPSGTRSPTTSSSTPAATAAANRSPTPTWHALIEHTTDLDSLDRLATGAQHRGLDHHTDHALKKAADAGNKRAARRLADVRAERGDLAPLRALADAGDDWAANRLADVLAKRGDLDELRARADAGDERWWAAGSVEGSGGGDAATWTSPDGRTWRPEPLEFEGASEVRELVAVGNRVVGPGSGVWSESGGSWGRSWWPGTGERGAFTAAAVHDGRLVALGAPDDGIARVYTTNNTAPGAGPWPRADIADAVLDPAEGVNGRRINSIAASPERVVVAGRQTIVEGENATRESFIAASPRFERASDAARFTGTIAHARYVEGVGFVAAGFSSVPELATHGARVLMSPDGVS